MNKEYKIVGDTEEYGTCMIYVCKGSREHAENVLNRILNNPNWSDLQALKTHKNIRIKENENEEGWWNKGGLDLVHFLLLYRGILYAVCNIKNTYSIFDV